MKHYSLILIMALTWSCTTQSQSLNIEIKEEGKQPHLLGKIDKSGLTSSNYNHWFLSQFNDYQLNDEVIHKIKQALKQYHIIAFMGTWCGDSRREVPRFYKVLEAANFPIDQLTMVAVSRKPDAYKQSPNHEEQGLNVHRVPIFIFYKNGVEVNRIVESPVASFEEDILNIIDGDYQSNYHLVTLVNELIDDADFTDKAMKLLPKFKELTNNIYELNTYSKILATTKRKNKSIEVLKLNTKLFPKNPAVYISLANACFLHNRKNQALVNYEKALELNPTNTKLKNRIDALKSGLSSSNN